MSGVPADRPLRPRTSGQGGSVLVLVLVVMTIGVGLALYISGVARETVRSAFLLEDKLKAKLEAESQLELVRFLLATNPFRHSRVDLIDRDFDPTLPASLSLLGDRMQWHNSVILLRDTASMLTVPWCDPDFLQRFLRARGVSQEKAAQAADTWLDWLDKDDFKHLNGAERFDYSLGGISAWTPRNSLAMQAWEEAGLVSGLQKAEVWQQIESELVWTVRGGSNINTASAPMLQALLEVPPEQAAQLISRRKEMGLLTLQDLFQITGKSAGQARGEIADFPNFIVEVKIQTTIGEAREQLGAVLDFLPREAWPVTTLRYEQ